MQATHPTVQPRRSRVAGPYALGITVVAALTLTGCSLFSSAETATPSAGPASVAASPSSVESPLPDASLGAQETGFVGVTLYLKSNAVVAQQVEVTVNFRDGGKKFASATVGDVLRPGEHASLLVKPDYSGHVPMGYTSKIASLRASDTAMPPSDEPTAPPSASQAPVFTNSPEPSAEASVPAETASPSTAENPDGAQIESAGDYVCHAGIDNLPDLSRGTGSTSDVMALQVVLDQLGYPPGPVDGRFGRRTEAAVKGFQSQQGLAVDGQVGPRTWTAIVNAYC